MHPTRDRGEGLRLCLSDVSTFAGERQHVLASLVGQLDHGKRLSGRHHATIVARCNACRPYSMTGVAVLYVKRSYVSLTTFLGSLSSRKAMYLVCLSLSAPVHSAKSMRTTVSGFTQMHVSFFQP